MGQRISVAIATYNGAKFIEEQLLSICRQTRKPDEIVVSDDGSKDETLEIVSQVAQSEAAQGIDFVVLTDNPRHGYCGNFEWAITHTTGDLIFLADQDDVWIAEKVEYVCAVYAKHPHAQCVIHGASLIDESGNSINGEFHKIIKLHELPVNEDHITHLNRDEFLESAISSTLANGMVMCISRALLSTALPFPKSSGLHDSWLGFCAVCTDQCWYLSRQLAQYRLHGNNTCGNSAKKTNLTTRIRRIKRKILTGQSAILERYYLGEAMTQYMKEMGLSAHNAYGTAIRVHEIGFAQMEALRAGGLAGAYKLCKLYRTDMRYRRSGKADFLYQLAAVTFHKKNSLQ